MLIIHILTLVAAIIALWVSSRIVISGIDHFAKRLQTSAFSISFLVLGILTSITEMSVGINAVIANKPEIFIGNYIGGSLVILLFIIPLLAFFNNGIRIGTHLRPKRMVYFLLISFAPVLTLIDGRVSMYEALVLILLYVVFIYSVENEEQVSEARRHHVKVGRTSLMRSILLIIVGSVIIFGASKFIVAEILYFADLLRVAPFLISILLLSVGTNLPEISIALNAIRMRETDVAIGDFIGSAAVNTLLFGIFSVLIGPYAITLPGYWITFIIVSAGYVLFYSFLRSGRRLTPREGVMLALLFVVFIIFHTTEIVSVAKRENAEPLTREEVVLLLRNRYLELNDYESDTLPPKSIITEQTPTGWYAAFLRSGSGIPSILDARCYFVSTGRQIREVGAFTRGPEEFVRELDITTCTPIESEGLF